MCVCEFSGFLLLFFFFKEKGSGGEDLGGVGGGGKYDQNLLSENIFFSTKDKLEFFPDQLAAMFPDLS